MLDISAYQGDAFPPCHAGVARGVAAVWLGHRKARLGPIATGWGA